MRFKANFPANRIANSELVYRSDEYSFDVVPTPAGSIGTSVLVNDLNLELDIDRRVISVWGVCPYTDWKSANLSPPSAEFGEVIFVANTPLTRGASLRLNEKESWPVLVDASSGWVRVGAECEGSNPIKILVGIILMIDRKGDLCGIWLRPNRLPKFV